MRPELRQVANDLQATANRLGQLLAQEGVSYRVPSFGADSADFTSDDWNGDEAEGSYPNPSDDDTDLEALAGNYLLAPEGDDAAGAKSNYKLPVRNSHEGPINTNALEAVIAAINGARGGVEGVSDDVLQSAYDQAVDLLVAAGVYDDADDAPDYDPANAADADADPDDDPDDAAAQAADADPAPDDPGDDGAVFDGVDLSAELTATISAPDDVLDDADLEAADGGGLQGIIWGGGDHDLGLGGEATPVHVPPETVQPTFEALQEDVEAGQVEIGLDHADDDSVLAQAGLREIGVAEDVAMAADGEHIVLTDSRFTSDDALEAFEAGEFDSQDFSVVAGAAVATDESGDRMTTDSGRLVIDAVRINRIDVVKEGAVSAASVGRVPELAAGAETLQRAAKDPNQHSQDAVSALQASAAALDDITDMDNPIDPDDFDDLDAAKEQLSAAADVIEDLQNEKDNLEAQASAFEDVAEAHDVDPDDYDDAQAAAQAVVDAQTEDIRAQIADLEADLPKYDVEDGDTDDRAEELAGSSRAELRNLLNDRKADKLDALEAQQDKGRAATQRDQASGRSSALQASGSGDGNADEIALSAMGGRDRIEQQSSDLSPSEFIAQKYDVTASDFDAADELADEINAAATGDA